MTTQLHFLLAGGRKPVRTEQQRFKRIAFREANGERRLRHFSDPDEAKREAEIIATRLANGQTDVTKLRNTDVAELLSVRQRLDPLKVSVTQAVTEFAAATERLPKGSTLLEAVDYFAKRHPTNMPRKTVNEVVEEFLTDRARLIRLTPACIRNRTG